MHSHILIQVLAQCSLFFPLSLQLRTGLGPDYASASRALGLTRARLTQVLNLLLLAPEIQERVLRSEVSTERRIRPAVGEPDWEDQLALCPGTSNDGSRGSITRPTYSL